MKQFYNYNDEIIIYHGDCLEVMAWLIKHGIRFDAIMADLPFGTTAAKWDTLIPMNDYSLIKNNPVYYEAYLLELIKNGASYTEALERWESRRIKGMWHYYKALIKTNGAIVLNAADPFTSMLQTSNQDWYKYRWIWYKNTPTGFVFAKYQPMRIYEDICIFYKETPTFNRQKTKTISDRKTGGKNGTSSDEESNHYKIKRLAHPNTLNEFVNPRNVLEIKTHPQNDKAHSSQKPLELVSYPIRTYSNPNDLILDNTAGSFTTAVACIQTGRRFIGIEQDEGYCKVGRERITKALVEAGNPEAAEGVATKESYQIGFKF